MPKIVTKNRKARRYYDFEEDYEAGLVLKGSEVKSIREGRINLKDSFATFRNDELWLVNAHIAPYDHGSHENHLPERERKLLLKRREIERIRGRLTAGGYSLIPLAVYFKDSWVKVQLGLGKGKKRHDRREDIKKKQHKREIERAHAENQDYF